MKTAKYFSYELEQKYTKVYYPLISVLPELMCYEKTFVKVKSQKSSEKDRYGLSLGRDIFSIKKILNTSSV